MGEGRSSEQGGVGEGWWARTAGSNDTRRARRHWGRRVFCSYPMGRAVSYHSKTTFEIKHRTSFALKIKMTFLSECIPTVQAQVFYCTLTSSCLILSNMATRNRLSALFLPWLLGNALVLLQWQSQELAGLTSLLQYTWYQRFRPAWQQCVVTF